jgi:hypothetical protein
MASVANARVKQNDQTVQPHRGAAAIGAGVAGFGVVDVEFVEDAVLAGVGTLNRRSLFRGKG